MADEDKKKKKTKPAPPSFADRAKGLLHGAESAVSWPIQQGVHALDSITGGATSRAINKGMDVADAPFAALSATIQDAESGYGWRVLDPSKPTPNIAKFKEMIGKGDFEGARKKYSIADPEANRARALATHEPVATYFMHHPTQFGLASGVAELLNPSYIATGEVGGEALRAGGQLARAAGVPSLSRFGEVSRAAAEAAAGGKAQAQR